MILPHPDYLIVTTAFSLASRTWLLLLRASYSILLPSSQSRPPSVVCFCLLISCHCRLVLQLLPYLPPGSGHDSSRRFHLFQPATLERLLSTFSAFQHIFYATIRMISLKLTSINFFVSFKPTAFSYAYTIKTMVRSIPQNDHSLSLHSIWAHTSFCSIILMLPTHQIMCTTIWTGLSSERSPGSFMWLGNVSCPFLC